MVEISGAVAILLGSSRTSLYRVRQLAHRGGSRATPKSFLVDLETGQSYGVHGGIDPHRVIEMLYSR